IQNLCSHGAAGVLTTKLIEKEMTLSLVHDVDRQRDVSKGHKPHSDDFCRLREDFHTDIFEFPRGLSIARNNPDIIFASRHVNESTLSSDLNLTVSRPNTHGRWREIIVSHELQGSND